MFLIIKSYCVFMGNLKLNTKVLFPFRGVANCNVLKASHVSCQLSWSPLPPGPPLACPPATDQWQ